MHAVCLDTQASEVPQTGRDVDGARLFVKLTSDDHVEFHALARERLADPRCLRHASTRAFRKANLPNGQSAGAQ
eukprot:3433220-Pleurochrysis_carterae.AAC.3